MIILGIDPGVATVGIGVIEYSGNRFRVLRCGVITTDKDLSLPDRLKIIYEETTQVIEEFHPDVVSIEELFFNNNVTTAIMVAQGRGVSILSAINAGLPVYEYTPLQVKQAVTGYGRAQKAQVQHMVKTLLGLRAIPRPDDAADALAIAICHAHSYRYQELTGGN